MQKDGEMIRERNTEKPMSALTKAEHKMRATLRPGKLAKQSGIDEEENFKCNSGPNDAVNMKQNERTERALSEQSHTNVESHVRQSGNTGQIIRPKSLTRSQAFSADDDPVISHGHTPLTRTFNSRTAFASTTFDSFTDSTGINLLSFIACTLHKNAKDRSMLLQLEEHMTALVKDSTRNSQKFPPMSSYNRMLVHRVAAFFGLDHNVDQNGTAVVVNKTSHTRLPDIEFSSLIQTDVFTDEPRRFLTRDVQSYEEVHNKLGSGINVGRRARSFEISDCMALGDSAFVGGCTPLHMRFIQQHSSTGSTDASSNQFLESPGSCYSYGDVPFVGIYSPSSENGTAHILPWSSSESYNSSVDFAPSLISPVIHNQNGQPSVTGGFAADVNLMTNKIAGSHPTVINQRPMLNRRSNTEVIPSRDFSIPEHSSMLLDEQQSVAVAPGEFGQDPIPANTGQGAGMCRLMSNYSQYSSSTAAIKLPQQMESLCLSDNSETVRPLPQTYMLYGQPTHPLYPQQYMIAPQSSVYPPQAYFVPYYARCHVLPSVLPQPTYPVYATNYPLINNGCAVPSENAALPLVDYRSTPQQLFETSTAATDKLPNG